MTTADKPKIRVCAGCGEPIMPDAGVQPHEHIILEISRERERQMAVEGWTPEHDDHHKFGDLALAASAYAAHSSPRGHQGDVSVGRSQRFGRAGWFNLPLLLWPFDHVWWKPKAPREDLIRAGALIVAEIERLDRAAQRTEAA